MSRPGPRRTQEERRGDAERRLVAAAAELVGEIGPARVTLANVGERAGYSRGLASHHFGSKGALMQRLVDTVTHQFREALFEHDHGADALAELRTLVGIYFDVICDLQPVNRARLVLWAQAVATPTEEIRPAMVGADREFREEIEKRLRLAAASGQIPASINPHGLATVIIAMLRGVALQSLIDDHVDLAAARGEIEQLLTTRLAQENPS
ncbi:transcriptional regulator, TetR family [Mycobacterium parascrofulaceum ATCC BAA-614]|uniref:Transcriptional regulator, TetR family n=1 Tax=Mycobacterium parascrofulaceum ATCC BAA-614 TaxID=525368 RepID=D5P617_9MYCO|nr:TetR/AcrR family transcriptional regulator [Mycobacterium parascrofulaceum]EFG78503.1 transcriptional regulator, TetR family [Mycobacterium parascrofulaceum ATCC BAA-614]